MRVLRCAAGLAFFALSALVTASLTSGCGECVGISCDLIHADNGTYRVAADTAPSWALELGDVVLTDTSLTIDYTDLDGEQAQAIWAAAPLP